MIDDFGWFKTSFTKSTFFMQSAIILSFIPNSYVSENKFSINLERSNGTLIHNLRSIVVFLVSRKYLSILKFVSIRIRSLVCHRHK